VRNSANSTIEKRTELLIKPGCKKVRMTQSLN
jgi:hypothetical protein